MSVLYDFKTFPLDHFGVVGGPQIMALMDQSTSNGKRKAAFRTLVRVAKEYRQIPRNCTVQSVGMTVNPSGVIELEFQYEVPQDATVIL